MAKWCNGFDAGNLTAWDSETEQGSSTVAPDTTRAYTGPYSLKVSHETGNFHAWVTHNLTGSNVFAKLRIWFNNFNFFNSEGDVVEFLAFNTGTQGLLGANIRRDAGGDPRWRIAARNGAAWISKQNDTMDVPLQEWIEVEVEWEKGNPGAVRMWVNGVLAIENTTWDSDDYGDSAETRIGGPYAEGLASTAEYWIDYVCDDTTQLAFENYEDLKATLFVGSDGSKDLYATFSAQATKDLYAELFVTQWLYPWSYRKKLTLTGSADGAQTDLHIGVKVYRTTGTDGTETTTDGNLVWNKAYVGNKCQSDFKDIRITTADGKTELDYYIETVDGSTSAEIWVKVDSIPASPATTILYLYYGNPTAIDESNGYDTFPVFDEFETISPGNAPDTNIWTTQAIGSDVVEITTAQYKVGSQSLFLDEVTSGDNAYARSDQRPANLTNGVLHLWFRAEAGGRASLQSQTGTPASLGVSLFKDDTNEWQYRNPTTYVTIPNWSAPAGNTWYRIEHYLRADTDKCRHVKDRTEDSGEVDTRFTWGAGELDLFYLGTENAYPIGFWIDQAYIRKWTPNMPTYSSWGTETSGDIGALDLYTKFEVQVIKDLFAKFEITGGTPGSANLFAEIEVRQTATKDLYAELFVGSEATRDLFAELIVTRPGTADLAAEFSVSIPTSADLKAIFNAAHPLPNWLSGWLYRKKHTITGTAKGVQTNYQMRFQVNYGSGSDSGDTVYLENKSKTDFGDIRFTTSDGETELDYWIEKKTDSSIAYIWVEVASIPISPNTVDIYIYYGNSVAVTTSSGVNTWINYVEYESESIGAVPPFGVLEATDVYDYEVSNEQAYHGTKSLKGNDTSTIARNQVRFNFTDVTSGGARLLTAARLSNDYNNEALSMHLVNDVVDSAITIAQGGNVDDKLQDYYSGTWHTITDFVINTWYLIEICWEDNAETWNLRFNGTWYNNRTKRADITDLQYANMFMAGVSTRSVGYWDVLCLGKYADAEPTNTSWSDEETFGSVDLKAVFSVGATTITADLKAVFFVGQEYEDLKAIMVIRNANTQDLFADTIIRHSASVDLAARFFIADLGSAELKAVFCVCKDGAQDLFAEFIVQQPYEDLKAIFIVTESAANNLFAEFIVQQPYEDLKAILDVRQPITNDLFAKFSITSPAIVMPPWSKYANNPIWNTSKYSWTSLTPDNFVILRDPDTSEPAQYNGYYWAAYNTNNPTAGGIGFCYSTDLINWTDGGSNPVLTPTGGWETDNICPVEFLYMGDITGHVYDFWLFYCGTSAGGQSAIGVAKSHDMASWDRYGSNPIANWLPSWTSNVTGIEDFRILRASNGHWYSIYEANQSPTGGTAVGCARSTAALPDSGWADVGRLISSVPAGWSFVANPAMAKKVIAGRHYYYSLFEAGSGGQAEAYGMYCAEDQFLIEDGWTHSTPYDALPAQPGWEDNSLIPNGMVFLGETLYVYYTGDSATAKQIGIATAPDFSEDLYAKFEVRHLNEELYAKFEVRSIATRDLYAEITIRREATRDLKATFHIGFNAQDLPAVFLIRQETTKDLKTTFYVLNNAQKDLLAVFLVRRETFVRRKVFGTVIIRHTQTQELKTIFKVSQDTITQELPAVFEVNQSNGSKDMLAYFNVRGMLRGRSLNISGSGRFRIRQKVDNGRIR